MTIEQELIERYKAWLLNGIYATIYYRNEKEWRDEVNQKIKELENKLSTDGMVYPTKIELKDGNGFKNFRT